MPIKNLLTFFFTILFIFFVTKNVKAAISISPAYVEFELDKGRPTGQFMVTNVGEEEERYRIKAIHFDFSEDGGPREITPDEHSLATWVKFNPKEFVLKPKKTQIIRFIVVPQGSLRKGEYWAAMELESLKTTFSKGKDGQGRELSVEIIPAILVPIFGKVGEVNPKVISHGIQVTNQKNRKNIEGSVSNTGTGRLFLSGNYEIVDTAGVTAEKGSLGRAYILPGASRKFSSPIQGNFSQGKYILKVQYKMMENNVPLKEEIEFDWRP